MTYTCVYNFSNTPVLNFPNENTNFNFISREDYAKNRTL